MEGKLKPANKCTIAELEAYSTPEEFARYYYFRYADHPTFEIVWNASAKVANQKTAKKMVPCPHHKGGRHCPITFKKTCTSLPCFIQTQ